VDVLKYAAARLPKSRWDDGRRALAAVAELIEAATELAEDQVHTDLDEPDYEPETSDAARARNKGQRIYWRVLAALARVGGAA
jgi:hypothetical protein